MLQQLNYLWDPVGPSCRCSNLSIMRYHFALALLGLFISPIHAAPSVVLEQVKGIPPGWSLHHEADPSDKITLFVALKEPGIEKLKEKLHERQNPDHPSFRQHLSRDEVQQYRQPARRSLSAVSTWLRSGGIRNVHYQGGLISFEATVKTVKSLLQADLAYYAYNGTNADPVLRALSYTIPSWLHDHIAFVHPISNFMPPRSSRGHRGDSHKTRRPRPKPKPTKTQTIWTLTPTSKVVSPPTPTYISDEGYQEEEEFPLGYPCLPATVPKCIKQLYNITYTPSGPSPVRFGVAGFLEQWILYSDVDKFLDVFSPHLPSTYNFTVELINNATNPQDSPLNAGIEASLDVEYAMSLGHPTNVVYYITGGRGVKLNPLTGEARDVSDNEPFLEFLDAMLAKPDSELPHVLSISYADDEPSVPRPYAIRVCDMFAALAARGVSVLVATGDAGAAGTGHSQCVVGAGGSTSHVHSHSYENSSLPSGQRKTFISTFPGSCPYVTAVGATSNVAPPVMGADFSAGGFSEYFSRPKWQDDVVLPYIEHVLKTLTRATNTTAGRKLSAAGMFNLTGRATPDISAIGSAFQIVMGGEHAQVLGTSASTPVVAAMIALINDARMRAGKPSLGWLNPLLYSAKVRKVLKDVTEGDSRGCHFPDGTESVGWPSAEGYDCVTGLGVVDDFNDFMSVLL